MEEEFSLDNILSGDELSLFDEFDTQEEQKDDLEKDSKNTTEADLDEEFQLEKPESVGGEDDNKDKEDTHSSNSDGSSPNLLFSSIAKAFAEEGILPDLDEETINNIKTPEDFRKTIDDYIKSELNEQQQRIKEALDNNVEPNIIKQYEGVINYLDTISEDTLNEETEEGETLRKKLIYQDFINRGFSAARAEKEVNKALQSGSDVDDAVDALESVKSFYKNQYNNIITNAKENQKKIEKENKEKTEKFRNNILDEKSKLFGDLEVDKTTRKRIYDNISKPIYKNPKTGEVYTAIQKYELENQEDFLTKLGLIFTLTDGFKNLDGLVKNKVKKEMKKGFRDLENKINNTSRDSYGNLNFVSGVSDSQSYFGKGLKLDV